MSKCIPFFVTLFFLNYAVAQVPKVKFAYGFKDAPVKGECLNKLEVEKMDSLIKMNKRLYSFKRSNERSIGLLWPLRQKTGLNDPGFCAVSAYFDHDPLHPGSVQDYACGSHAYDGADFDHTAMDIMLWPYGWSKMANNEVEVICAADGVIVYKEDGNYDLNCMPSGSSNTVAVEHADGSTTVYVHMKKFSLTSKGVGDVVTAGEYLGVVGSSGLSNGPHLHFELYDSTGQYLDTFTGSCHSSPSWWIDQKNYFNRAVNYLSTNFALPQYDPCPAPEIKNESINFAQGDSIIFCAFLSEVIENDSLYTALKTPTGAIYSEGWWVWETQAAAAWICGWYYTDEFTETGNWTFETDMHGEHLVHNYSIGFVGTEGQEMNHAISVFPNPVNNTLRINTPLALNYYVFSSNGQLVEHAKLNDAKEIDFTKYASGIYTIQVVSIEFVRTFKIIHLDQQ